MDVEFLAPTWEQIYSMLLSLAEKILSSGFRPDVIVGMSRGGWPPARVMSDLLEVPRVANVSAEFYLGVAKTRGDSPVITQQVSVRVEDKDVLVMDDVTDTGKSLQIVKKHILEQGGRLVKTATIYHKPWSVTVPDYYEKETESWIVFPWELKETVRCLVENCKKEGLPMEKVGRKLIESGVNATLVERFVKDVLKEKV